MNTFSAPEYIAGLMDGFEAFPEGPQPLVFTEIQISRQYSMHVVQLPGDDKPSWHRYLDQAIARVQSADFDRLTLIVNGEQYQLSLKP